MKSFFDKHAVVFGKSQVTAAAATLSDFLILAFLVEIAGLYYVTAVAIASAGGGIVNFYLNRKWAFKSFVSWKRQAVRYALVSGSSLGWNTFLVWMLTEFMALPYMLSKVCVVAVIGLAWNYPLHRYWVFAQQRTV